MSEYKPLFEILEEMQEEDIADCEKKGVQPIFLVNGMFYDSAIFKPLTISKMSMTYRYKIRPREQEND